MSEEGTKMGREISEVPSCLGMRAPDIGPVPQEQGVDPVTEADDLLRRLDEWDQMNVTAPGADGPYWKREIARVRALLSKGVDRQRGERLREALVAIETDACYDPDWTVERLQQALEDIHNCALAALAPDGDLGKDER